MFEIKKILNSSKEPLFNESLTTVVSGIRNQPTSYSHVKKLIKNCPEMIGILTAISTDIISDGFSFIGPDSRVKVAEDFVKNRFFKQELKKGIFDWLEYGDGYLWNGFVSAKLLNKPMKPTDFSDEDLTIPVKHISTETVSIFLNKQKTRIDRFEQQPEHAAFASVVWEPKEVIHAKYLTLDGKIYGWSPTMSLLPEINTLAYIKDYAKTWFHKGGIPDFAFIGKNITETQRTKVIQMLQKYKNPQEKHGNMVFSGDWDMKKLNDFSKDMEFRDLYVTLVGTMALGFNMPMSRLAPVLGIDVSVGTGVDDASVDAYWGKISEHQDYWENILNSQLFNPFFNVELKFNKGYKQNEFREAQRDQMVNDRIVAMAQAGMEVNQKYVNKVLHMRDEDWKKFELNRQPSGMERQAMMNKQQVEKGPASQGHSRVKQNQSKQPKKVV